MGKKAVLIGCNYTGIEDADQLQECVNDVFKMHECLVGRYGFSPDSITVLVDHKDASYHKPTGVNIWVALQNLVLLARPGDLLFVLFSGHGTRFPRHGGDFEDNTGYDECIVSGDLNCTFDDDLRELVDQIPEGCSLTMISDSCHSGGLIEGTKEQIGESTKSHQTFQGTVEQISDVARNTKYLPLSNLTEILKSKTGKHDLKVEQLPETLREIFGEYVSPKLKKLVKSVDIGAPTPHVWRCFGFLGMFGNIIQRFLNHDEDLNASKQQVPEKIFPDHGEVLISGRQSSESSYDGVLTNAILRVIDEMDGVVSIWDLVSKVREMLKNSLDGEQPNPGLYCSDNHVNSRFLS